LLSQRSSLGRMSTMGTNAELHREWRMRHSMQLSVLNKTEADLAKSIAEQKSSDIACSARLLQSKRKLDGLLKETKILSMQVAGHEEVLETESENLKVTKESIAAVESAYDAAIEDCEKLKKEALEDLKQYTAELKELQQIANHPAATYETAKIQQRSLLEIGAFTREHCLAFVQFTQKHAGRFSALKDVPKKACDEQREELQKAFTKAYKDLAALKKEAKERSEDTTCFEDAKSEKMAKLVPLTAQSQESVKKIEAATAAIASLEPILENLRERTDKLMHKIDEELVPECFEADEVSEMLTKIREMILALEECPGRGDFKLTIPKVTPKGPAPLPAAKAKEVIAEAKEEIGEAKEEAKEDAIEEALPESIEEALPVPVKMKPEAIEKKESIEEALPVPAKAKEIVAKVPVEEKKESIEEALPVPVKMKPEAIKKKESIEEALPVPAKAKEIVAKIPVEEKKEAVEDAVEEKKEAVEEKKEAVADAVEEKKEAVADAVEEKKEAVADAVEEAAEPEAAAEPAPAEPAPAEPDVAEPETVAEPEEATEPPAVEPESVAEPEEATEPEAAKEAPTAEAPAETKKEPEKEAAAPAAEGNNNDDNGDYYTYYEAGSLAQKKTKRRVRKHQPTK